jgi:hypothetical protein
MRNTGHVRVAKSYSADKSLIPNFLVLSLLLCLTGLTAACGGLSQGPAGQLIVSIPSKQTTVGVAYNAVCSVSGGSAPYFFSISAGSLPPGLILNRTTGSITGIPLVAGTFNSVLLVTDPPQSDPRQTEAGSNSVRYGSSSMRIVVSDSSHGITISISPSSATIASNGKQQFTASLSGTANTSVTWSASAGTISSSGAFTTPKVTSTTSVTITATSVANASSHAAATVTVTPQPALAIVTSALGGADAGTPYTALLSATGGVPPYQWSFTTGALPSGIQLRASSGVITGMTALTGSYPFSAKVTDASGNSATTALTLTVSSSSATGFDGPAELPRIYIQSAMSNTPAPGSTNAVNSGGDLQSALNSANCGDTIQLQAGATFTGAFTFPAKSCDDNHWIIVRTSTPDANLPPERTRMTPCYAGVASLPGRPAFPCTQPQRLLATITYSGASSGPITFANGANHYRLLGLEITRIAGNGHSVVALVGPVDSGSMNKIVLDRLYLHGVPVEETRRGVALSGGTSIAIQDSYISDFHCNLQGACTDSQAVSGGGTGSLPTGPLKIDDNFLEAAGENILFGGGATTQTPADIEIRFNHLFKPMFWLQGQPGFVGPSFIVKNHFELKNAQRVLFDSNVLEDSWGGFSQAGFSVVINAKNQSGSLCPICQVTDVTIRYVTISHVGGVFVISNALDVIGGDPPLDGERYSIHDVVADDIDQVKYAGHGNFAQISTIPTPILQNVKIDHVTAFPDHVLFNVGAPVGVKMPGFVFTNSIVASGDSALNSTGGDANCANSDVPLTIMQQCFSGYLFSSNAILAAPAQYPPSKWPSGNSFYSSGDAIGFVSFSNGNGGDYHLLPSSPAKGAASDGTDLGANVDAVLAALSNVR